jgi:hypothetical protein
MLCGKRGKVGFIKPRVLAVKGVAKEPGAIGDLMPLGLADGRSVELAVRAAIRNCWSWYPSSLVASHRSGYVRAEALRLLSSDESLEVMPYILLRLIDWVDEVRSQNYSGTRESGHKCKCISKQAPRGIRSNRDSQSNGSSVGLKGIGLLNYDHIIDNNII